MRRQGLMALVLLPVLTLSLTGCGDGNAAGGTASATRAAATSDADKMRAFAKCMRANGVDMPDPSEEDGRVKIKKEGGAGKTRGETTERAENKCRHLMPNGGKPIKPNAADLARMREFAKCMRANGVPGFPDPAADGAGIEIKREGGLGSVPAVDPKNPAFQAAQKKCRSKQPRGPKFGGGRP
jgi:hypothetical protein